MDPADYEALLGQGPPPVNYGDLAGYLGYDPNVAVAPPGPPPPPVLANPSGPITTPDSGPGPGNLPAGPVVSPEENPGISSFAPSVSPATPLVQPGTTTTLKAGQGAGFSQSGYSPSANAAIQAGPKTQLDRQMAQDQAAVGQEFAPITNQFNASQVGASQAALDEAHINSAKFAATSEGKQKMAQAQADFMLKEQSAIDQGRKEAASIMSDYKSAQAEFAASRVNPAQLWEAAGGTGQAEMVATAFIHDFLGAKGIQTSGLDSIRTAIKQNIDSQLENMKHKGDVAQGFKQLWDMQRAQSATDAEARARMNGFYLSSLTNQIDAQLGMYDSKLALAKGQSAVAKLQEENAKNDLLVAQHIETAANARTTNRVHEYAAELQASSAKYAANAHLEAARIEAAAKNKPVDPKSGLLIDTSQSGGNIAFRRMLPGIKPETHEKLQTDLSNAGNTVRNVQKLIELQDAISKTPPTNITAIKKLQDEAARTAELVRNTTKMGIIYDNSGKQINEQEVKLYDEIVGPKDWWVNGDNTRTLGQLAKQSLDKVKTQVGGFSEALQPGDPAYGFKTGEVGFAPGESTLANIQSAPGAGRPQETAVDKAEKQILSPKSLKETMSPEEAGDRATLVWNEYVKNHPDEAVASSKSWFAEIGDSSYAKEHGLPNIPVPRFALGLDQLGELAMGGNTAAQAELERIASQPVTDNASKTLSEFAQYELSLTNQK